MQIELVETFLDLAASGSFNRTADRLAVTQSTVSGRIKSLETSLGSRLFNRSKAGASLTPAGERFRAHAASLLHEWNEARRMTLAAAQGESLRIGLQNDLAALHAGEWLAEFRRALPHTKFYIEADYSTQMGADLLSGELDLAVLYTPRHLPDLHYEMAGETAYRMVSTDCAQISAVLPERYVFANYSPAFAILHRQALPHLTESTVAGGQGAVIAAMLEKLGGTAFLPEETARKVTAGGIARIVADVEPILQPVFIGVHVRNRHKPAIRKLMAVLKRALAQR
jgi:DNA-binding transcriptional LysR family regulator